MADPIATVSDLRVAFGEAMLNAFGDVTEDGELDEATAVAELRFASDLARSYFSFAIPDPPPLVLVGYVADIAAWRMAGARGISSAAMDRRYEAAIQWLRDAGAGKVQLAPPSTEPTASAVVLDPEAVGRERIWTQDTVKGIF